jgi:cell wall-associated NlpC family hydrolase
MLSRGIARPAAALVSLLALAMAPVAAGAPPSASWAKQEIELVTSQGLLGGDAAAFRPDDPLTAGELAELVRGLGGVPTKLTTDPSVPVSIAELDSALVRGLGLGDAARRFAAGLRLAGLTPSGRFGTEVVARLLGLRLDHPQDALELGPADSATRAEAAYSAAKILRWQGWETSYVEDLAAAFAPPPVAGWQQTILQTAVSLVGYPYVSGGTSENPESRPEGPVPGGFDCSGLIWRVYKTARYAVATSLAETLRGRSTYAMSGEVPRSERIGYALLEPGDVVFFGPEGPRSKPAEISHMGVYLGGGWIVHAASTGVSVSPLASGYYRPRFAWARRPLAEAGLAEMS